MLLLFIKIILLHLHKFCSLLLASLISSLKSWSLWWIILDNAISMVSLMLKIPFFVILDIICSSLHILKSFAVYPGWVICRLSFNHVTIIIAPMCCCFIILFTRGGLLIGFFISDSITSMFVRMVISYISVYTTSSIRFSIFNYLTTLMVMQVWFMFRYRIHYVMFANYIIFQKLIF